MKHFTDAVRQAIETENWYAALTLALLLPDICGKLENPAAKSQARYVSWFEKWILPKYTINNARGSVVFLSGNDCYALRCALSHEGRGEVSDQRAKEVLDDFVFNTPHPHYHLHCNRINNTLQLQVDIFASDICGGVDQWLAASTDNPDIAARIAELITIHDTANGVPGVLGFS